MDVANLIRMANGIGEFFSAMPDRQEGLDGIADHLKRFWEPRMRTTLLSYLEANPQGCAGDVCLHPLVCESITRHRQALLPVAR